MMNNSAELNKVITAAIQRSPCAVGIEAEIVCSFFTVCSDKKQLSKKCLLIQGVVLECRS